jgi:hypothetical protein
MSDGRAALLVRVSVDLKAKLAELAKRERRSVSKQVELLLEDCLGSAHKATDERREEAIEAPNTSHARRSKRSR